MLHHIQPLFKHRAKIDIPPPSFNQDAPAAAPELDEVSRSAYERRIQRLEDERKELVRKLTDTNVALQKMAHGSPSPVVNPAVVGSSPTKNNEAAADSNKAAAASSEKSGAEVRKLQDEVREFCTRLITFAYANRETAVGPLFG